MIWGAVDFSSWQEHVLNHMRKAFQGPGLDGINLQVMEGDPGEAITLYAQKISAELVLIPSHGRKGLSRLVSSFCRASFDYIWGICPRGPH